MLPRSLLVDEAAFDEFRDVPKRRPLGYSQRIGYEKLLIEAYDGKQ